ncbi:hypothetical protein KR054_002729 [Drosophila jambulina]|nr:hypothetical protein KR054_002729 [Drosophila jambulina]
MKFTVTTLLVVLALVALGMASKTKPKYNRIPFGMAEFGPFRGKDLSVAMPLSKNLTQLERLNLAEKCLPFRRRCSMAEECCSQKCLVHIQRCNA